MIHPSFPVRPRPVMLAALLLAANAGVLAQTNDCAGFAAQAPAGISLKTEVVAADATRPPGVTTGPMLVGHCRVTGRMAERTGQDGKPYHIGFELRLPVQWNGRFLYQGGGGNDGVVRPAVGPQAAPGYALNRGFAVVTTDAGHQGPTRRFRVRPDRAHRQRLQRARPRGRDRQGADASATTPSRPDKSYFIGCSGGGRQGMMFTQRFPSYFDGVIAMAPAMRVSKGATIAAAWDTQALQAIAPPGADGKPVLSRALTRKRPGRCCARASWTPATRRTASPTAWCPTQAPASSTPAALQCKGAKTRAA